MLPPWCLYGKASCKGGVLGLELFGVVACAGGGEAAGFGAGEVFFAEAEGEDGAGLEFDGEGGEFFENAGWYDDVFVRTAEGWKIKHRVSRSNWWGGNLRVLMTDANTSEGMPLTTTRQQCDAGTLMFYKAVSAK